MNTAGRASWSILYISCLQLVKVVNLAIMLGIIIENNFNSGACLHFKPANFVVNTFRCENFSRHRNLMFFFCFSSSYMVSKNTREFEENR